MQTDGAPVSSRRPVWLLHRATVLVLVVGLAITGALSLAANRIHGSNEDRLLGQRSREAATSIAATIPNIVTPLISAADLAEATGADQQALTDQLTALVTNGERFVSASIWLADGSDPAPLVVVGTPPQLATRSPERIREVLAQARNAEGFAVYDLTTNEAPGLGYSVMSTRKDPRYVAYVERVLPQNRTSYERTQVAFDGLDSATYLGGVERADKLLTSSRPDTPLTGRRSTQTIPFGDTQLLLVVSPRGELGGALAERLWWLLLTMGVPVTAGMALLVERLQRRRELAERLADENRRLYAEQRTVAQTLQHSLLPSIDQRIGDLAFASLYEPASTEGVDIGGDWYDAISVDPDRVLFAVGDVSGRGLGAATVMASMRYAIRAFANHGLDPDTILTELSSLLDVSRDGHFATVVCGVIDVRTNRLSFANAGHPPLLLLDGGDASFARAPVGPPVGIAREHAYEMATVDFAPGTTVVAFTDGLYERRGETIDTGLERLRKVGTDLRRPSEPAAVLEFIRSRLGSAEAEDDTAMLGVAWTT